MKGLECDLSSLVEQIDQDIDSLRQESAETSNRLQPRSGCSNRLRSRIEQTGSKMKIEQNIRFRLLGQSETQCGQDGKTVSGTLDVRHRRVAHSAMI